MTEPTYFLRWTDASGAPHATTEPMPRRQLKSAVLSLARQGGHSFRVWEEQDLYWFLDDGDVVIGDALD
jgi:hypothetical protein